MKLLILGIVAAGKTTLARELSAITGVPWYEGDRIAYEDGTDLRRTREEEVKLLEKIDACGEWIVEEVYRSSHSVLLEWAERIVFLDPPLGVRKRRIFTRFLRQQCGLEKCRYKSNLHMLRAMYRWIASFEKDRPRFEAMLQGLGDKVTVVHTGAQVLALKESLKNAACQMPRGGI